LLRNWKKWIGLYSRVKSRRKDRFGDFWKNYFFRENIILEWSGGNWIFGGV
jgi:hypothetical protein